MQFSQYHLLKRLSFSHHIFWQPAPPGTVRPLFLCRRFACLTSCEQRFPASVKRFLEIFSQAQFPRMCGGPRGPNSQGKAKPHGQVYALWESSSEPHLSGTFLAPIKTPLCVKLHSLSGGLKCAAMHLLENPSTYSSLALTDVLFL